MLITDAVAGLMKVSLKRPGKMQPTSMRCLLVPIDVYIGGRRLIPCEVACEHNGFVEAPSSMRRDAEVAPKFLLRSLVTRKKRDSLETRDRRESDHGGLHHHLNITEQCQ